MATLSKPELIAALTRLGELATARGESIELLLVGGTAMVLAFDARESTRDVDVLILAPEKAATVRALADVVAAELGWASHWLNDGAKGFFVGPTCGPIVLKAPGIVVRRPEVEQLLAMKLCAWRDDVDIGDARRLLSELSGSREEIWHRIEPFLQPGRELNAKYAFDDLWEEANGTH
jgi:hypothetical protein